MGAGPLPEPLHRLLIALARLRAALRLPSLAPLAPLAHAVLNALKYGEHRGGMFLQAQGTRGGRPVTRSWHLLAEGDDGPLIPSMAIEALVRQCQAGKPPAPGARSGIDALSLADYDALFSGRSIVTGWREEADGAIYRQILGASFAALPGALQTLHAPGPRSLWSGRATVQRGTSRLAALVAALFGFPKAGQDIPVSVTFRTAADGTETWGRNFDGRLMVSTQEAGVGRNAAPHHRTFRSLRLWAGPCCGRPPPADHPPPLVRFRSGPAARPDAERRQLRNRERRQIPLSCRNCPAPDRPRRHL